MLKRPSLKWESGDLKGGKGLQNKASHDLRLNQLFWFVHSTAIHNDDILTSYGNQGAVLTYISCNCYIPALSVVSLFPIFLS